MAWHLDAEQRRYVLTETVTGAAIGAVFSLGFALALFGGRASAPLLGPGGLVSDAVPHTFMIAFPTALATSLLTRKRLGAAKVQGVAAGAGLLPRNVLVRSLLLGAMATAFGLGLHALALPYASPPTLPILAVLTFKTAYGAVVAAIIARVAATAALHPPVVRP